MPHDNYEYDVFLSYAISDRIEIVNELAYKLEDAGIKIWYSRNHLALGKNLDETIREGLIKSRHGILVITHNYLGRAWPQLEFHALWAREGTRIFPIWHEITAEEIERYDSRLAKYWAIDTKLGIDQVVKNIVDAIREENNAPNTLQQVRFAISTNFYKVILAFLILLISLFVISVNPPAKDFVNAVVERRINTFQTEVLRKHIWQSSGMPDIKLNTLNAEYQMRHYDALLKPYADKVEFYSGAARYDNKTLIEKATDVSIDQLIKKENCGFVLPNVYSISHSNGHNGVNTTFVLLNTQSVGYNITEETKINADTYIIEVEYQNPLRYISITFKYSDQTNWQREREVSLMGLLPVEVYKFERQDNQWEFTGLYDKSESLPSETR